jgi:hypothetical protein
MPIIGIIDGTINPPYFMFKDYLGSPINVGDLGIRVDVNRATYAPFKQFKVIKIDESKRYDHIGILIEDGKRMSWVGSEQIIIEKSLSVKLTAWNSRYKLNKKETLQGPFNS